eukprot:3007837-Pyramimonas_sp.AAC.1
MLAAPLGPSVEFPMGPRSAVLNGEDACESCHWNLRLRTRWGYKALYWVEETPKRCTGRGGHMRTLPLGPS